VLEHESLALIGPSGCGKSTLPRSLNRELNDTVEGVRVDLGAWSSMREPIYAPDVDPVLVRRRVGMVFSARRPFPVDLRKCRLRPAHRGNERSAHPIGEAWNAPYAAPRYGRSERSPRRVGMGLSGGQQQRLLYRARRSPSSPRFSSWTNRCSALDPSPLQGRDLVSDLRRSVTM